MPQSDSPGGDDSDRTYNRRRLLTGAGSLAAGGLLASTGLVGAEDDANGREPGPKTDEVLVGISPSVSNVADEIRSAIPGDAEIEHTNEAIHYAVVSFPSNAPDRAREQFIEAITSVDVVEYAEPNATIEALGAPNDPYYGSQHTPQQVNCEDAWETTLGDEDVTIAIVDQGIQYDHPVLADNMDDSVPNHGQVFVGRGRDPYPIAGDERHGTHVAGIAAAGTDNSTGHAGISNCSLLSARALDRSGRGALSDIADAVQWSVDAGADIINLSLGASSGYRTLRSACRYAVDQGVLVVGASGNDGRNSVAYPAAYDDVLGVSALNGTNSLASFSNTGSQIDLAAPGSRVLSAVPWNEYARMSGTSMAAPVVAGVAGLVLSAYPGLSGEELRDHLTQTAVDVGLSRHQQGAGRVDAAAAVTTVPDGYEGDEGDEDDGIEDEEEDDETGAEDGHLLAFVADTETRGAGYEFGAEGPVEFTTAPYESPFGRPIEGGTYVSRDFIEEEDDGTYRAGGVTGNGHGDAFRVDGSITSIDIEQPDGMWVELDGEEMTVEEVIDATGGNDGDEDEDEDEADEPTCGDETVTAVAEGELDGNWWGDSDRYIYSARTANPCDATLSLDRPADGGFSLYVTRDGRTPTRWDYDEATTGSPHGDDGGDGGDDSDDPIELSLDGDEQLRLKVHAVNGSGAYTVTIEERGR